MKARPCLLSVAMLGALLFHPVHGREMVPDDIRHEPIAQLAWEIAKDDAIIIAQIGPQGHSNAEENKRFKKFTTETLSLIADQPKNYAAIYQSILQLDHLTVKEVPAFSSTWFDELLNRAFPRNANNLFLDPAFAPEEVRWMQNVNRLNRALSEVLRTYDYDHASEDSKKVFQKILDYLLAKEHLLAPDLLSTSKVNLGLAIIRWAHDKTQKGFVPLFKDLAWHHPNRAIRLMAVNHMLYHLRDFERTLEDLFRSYKWQKEFWFDLDEVPDFTFDLLAHSLILTSSKRPSINTHIAKLLWQFIWPGILAPAWLSSENIPAHELYAGHYTVLTKTFQEAKGSPAKDHPKDKSRIKEANGSDDLAEEDRLLRFDDLLEADPAIIKEITTSPRWKQHLAILKTMSERSMHYWHIITDIINPLYKISTKTMAASAASPYLEALELFNLGLKAQLRQRNVMQMQGQIVHLLHYILLNHPGWAAFCQEQNITLAANLPLKTLDVWRLRFYPLMKNGSVQLSSELRAWYDFLTDAPETTQKLYEQILSIRPYYQFMVENGQGTVFIKAITEFIVQDKIFSLNDAHQLLLALQAGITTIASEVPGEGAEEASLESPTSTQDYLTELGQGLNEVWFPENKIINKGQHSNLLSPHELSQILDLLRPYRHELVPLFMPIERDPDSHRKVLAEEDWERFFTKEILPNIFTNPENLMAQLTQFTRLAGLGPQNTLTSAELGTILTAIEPLFNRSKNRLGQKSYTFNLGDFLYRNLREEQLLALILWMQGQNPPVPAQQQFWAVLEMSVIKAALMDNPRHPQRDIFLTRLMDIAESTALPLTARLEGLSHIFYLQRKSKLKTTTIHLDRIVRKAVRFLQEKSTVKSFLDDIAQNHSTTLYELTSLLTPALMQFVQENGRTSVVAIIKQILAHQDIDNSLLPGSFKDTIIQGKDRTLLSIETIASIFRINRFNLNNIFSLLSFSVRQDPSDLFTLALVRKFMAFLKKGDDRKELAAFVAPVLNHQDPLVRLYAQTAYWANPSTVIPATNFGPTLEKFLTKVYLREDSDLRLRVKLLPLHDLFSIRQDFQENTEFILRTIFLQVVQTQPRVNARTVARLGGALGSALFQDITNMVNAKSEDFAKTKSTIIANLTQQLDLPKINTERRILIQNLLYGFTHNRFLNAEEEKFLEQHLRSEIPSVFFHAIKEVVQHKKTNLYPTVVKLLEQTDFLADLLAYPAFTSDPPSPVEIKKVQRIFYLLSLLNRAIRTGNLRDQLAPHSINTFLRQKLEAYPLRPGITLEDLNLETLQLDFLFSELPPKDQFAAILTQRLAAEDFQNAHELLAMLAVVDLKTLDPNLYRQKMIPLLQAFFNQVGTQYRDLFINGLQDYRPFMKTPNLTMVLNHFAPTEQINFLLSFAQYGQGLLKQDPAQTYLAFVFYNLVVSFVGTHQFSPQEIEEFQDKLKALAAYFIEFPPELAAWPAGQVLRIYFLGHYDYELLGMTLKQWKKWVDFFKKEGRQILIRAQDSRITPANKAYLTIPPQAPVNHLHGVIPPMRKTLNGPKTLTVEETAATPALDTAPAVPPAKAVAAGTIGHAAIVARPFSGRNPCPRYLLP